MKKLVIVFVAIIIATLSMTACGSNEEEIRELAKYELVWDEATDYGYTDDELVSCMANYAIDNNIHVNDTFINSVKEGSNTDYYLLNDNGTVVKLVKAENSNTIYYIECGGIY